MLEPRRSRRRMVTLNVVQRRLIREGQDFTLTCI
jgi:hypothetical protein